MKKIGLIFPGQGSQYVGMGKSDELKDFFLKADQVLDYKLSDMCFNGPEEKIKLTENTQPAILRICHLSQPKWEQSAISKVE